MCREYSRDGSHRHSLMSIDSQAQAYLPPLPVRTMTQPTAPADRDRKVIDTNNLDEQDLKNLKKYDPFLYYSIPSAVRDTKTKVVSNEDFQVQPALQDQDGSQSSIDSNPATTATTTSTMVERKSRISYECHPDLLLESLLEDDDSDYSVEHEYEDCDAVDPILQLMNRYSTMRRQMQ